MDIVVKHLILPSTLIALSASIGLVLLGIRSVRRRGVSLCIFVFVVYMICASGPIAFMLLGHLEYQIATSVTAEREGVRTIVVLAAHAESDKDTPLSSHVNSAAATRLLEVLSLFHAASDITVIVSGGGMVPGIMRDVLATAGIPVERMVVDADSFSTVESARHLAQMLGTEPFLLVTSAGHMPRAMGAFQKAGLFPRAVPTHYVTKRNWLAIQYLPSPVHLEYTDWAVAEYAALLWYWLNGWI